MILGLHALTRWPLASVSIERDLEYYVASSNTLWHKENDSMKLTL